MLLVSQILRDRDEFITDSLTKIKMGIYPSLIHSQFNVNAIKAVKQLVQNERKVSRIYQDFSINATKDDFNNVRKIQQYDSQKYNV